MRAECLVRRARRGKVSPSAMVGRAAAGFARIGWLVPTVKGPKAMETWNPLECEIEELLRASDSARTRPIGCVHRSRTVVEQFELELPHGLPVGIL